jgi:hypothetical protein
VPASATVIAVVGAEGLSQANHAEDSAPLEAPPEAVGDDAEHQKDG